MTWHARSSSAPGWAGSPPPSAWPPGLGRYHLRKNADPGGRRGNLRRWLTWDAGPTLVMMPEILQELCRRGRAADRGLPRPPASRSLLSRGLRGRWPPRPHRQPARDGRGSGGDRAGSRPAVPPVLRPCRAAVAADAGIDHRAAVQRDEGPPESGRAGVAPPIAAVPHGGLGGGRALPLVGAPAGLFLPDALSRHEPGPRASGLSDDSSRRGRAGRLVSGSVGPGRSARRWRAFARELGVTVRTGARSRGSSQSAAAPSGWRSRTARPTGPTRWSPTPSGHTLSGSFWTAERESFSATTAPRRSCSASRCGVR